MPPNLSYYLKHRSVLTVAALLLVWVLLQQVNSTGGLAAASGRALDLMLLTVPAFLVGIVLHEWAHAWASTLLGDPTARMMGRLTLNPFRHLDPLGTAMMLLAGFGWANPVPINPHYFRHPKRDMAIAAGAGPAMNLLIATVAIVAFRTWVPAYQRDPQFLGVLGGWFVQFLLVTAQINALLCVFNLLPIHPLDGSHFMRVFLSPQAYFTYQQNQLLIAIVGLALLFNGFFDPLFIGLHKVVRGLCLQPFWGV